jgi:hypothetical protein
LFVSEHEWTQDIFEVGFDRICTFSRVLSTIKNLERKVILVIYNASSFPNEKELHHGEVKVIFLPRNAPHFVNVWTKVSLENFFTCLQKLVMNEGKC